MVEPTNRSRLPEKSSFLFPAVVLTSTNNGHNDSAHTVNVSKPLSILTVHTDVAIMARPTYKIFVTYSKTVTAMHTAFPLLDTGTGIYLIHSTLICQGREILLGKIH